MSFFDELKSTATWVEERFGEIMTQRAPESNVLTTAVYYSLLNGGKRLRAYLVSEFCELCGSNVNNALDYACAIEMIHAFSLIHDDLPAMDDDDMRRGKPSNHKVFGEATAILAGDALALDAFAVVGKNPYCTPEKNVEAVIALSESSGMYGMCAGQQIDIDGEGNALSREALEKLVMHKTGKLFACACRLGCIAGDADKFKKEKADDFGIACGLAFQITDDLLDIHSTPEELGKTVGKDIAQEKSTFVSLLGEEGARELASDCIDFAKDCLYFFDDSDARKRLFEFCDYILTRKK